ncbi:MAG: UDP-N-acetylmuramoyl-tripeptide--D-alanyl-D-alanine ligase [bacterium]|nr:UDP-N-acetylmuramoyl-tripeptide--D-alanyl-D-alanine ligase [bacterium]
MSYSILSTIFFIAWFVRFVERVLFHVYEWQLKEYRWDRYRAYLNTRQGVWQVLNPWYWLGPLYFYWLYFFGDWSDITMNGAMIVVASSEAYVIISGIFVLYTIATKGLRRPDLTGRAVLVTALSLLIGLPIVITQFSYFEGIITYLPFFITTIFTPIGSLIVAPIFVALLVFLSSFPANYFKRRTIEKAKAKMASLPNLKVIGITGSYGKSSTKEFLATILSAKYKVCKTPANRNSEIGVAQTVLREIKSEHEVFIVEMGAYRKGEIKAICDIVHPTIGVLTAVSAQHLALFGSFEETKKAKYELIEALPENGIAIFNVDNRATRELAEQTLKPKKLYSIERPANIFATAITVQPEKLSFSLVIGEAKQHIVVPLLGAQAVSSLLAAITVAHALGMTLEEIANATKEITPLDHTLKPYHHTSGALIIDDAYSANPDGVLAALNHLKLIPRKYKVLVMMPMIELGSAGKDAHRKVGERIGEVCDLTIFTQKNFFGITRKASKLPDQKFIFLSSPKAILNALTPYLNENSVILLENRISNTVLKSLLQ